MTSDQLPEPRLTHVCRLTATLGEPQDLGDVARGRRRIVPLTGGTFIGPALRGTLLPGASTDWQIILPDGAALGEIRYTLRTERGELLYVRSRPRCSRDRRRDLRHLPRRVKVGLVLACPCRPHESTSVDLVGVWPTSSTLVLAGAS